MKTSSWKPLLRHHVTELTDDKPICYETYECINCHYEPLLLSTEEADKFYLSNYCPNCGCKMSNPNTEELL